ncbi:Rpn family recombination-promoting nuclease/putative transposase [Nocardia higoensis]|uniref:Rpn family recombination-promoting nuclease/putative transposase n=1 Tax=Nocardia higoensis TaxID=228599 RepID=A0ABS0DDG0_9NOCA|nr:Rpn family recombination-promoting nuclease/putative transposase [Nocardia higoensis]MBF6356499.1 Rpn family recombination-promoting nuclease/putative transposase [Nocardia higoensis]
MLHVDAARARHREHSDPPLRIPCRLAEYLVSIWNRYLEENPHTRTLPAIVPLVVHSAAHGRGWNTPTELSELIDLDPGTRATLGDHVPHLRLFLDDLTTVDLETLRERPLTPAARLVFVFHKIVPGNTHLGQHDDSHRWRNLL